MSTRAEQDAALSLVIRTIAERHLREAPEGLVRDLAEFTSGYTAGQIEKHARTPRSQQGPGRRRERGEGRKSA